jgi:serine/threonine protein kinase
MTRAVVLMLTSMHNHALKPVSLRIDIHVTCLLLLDYCILQAPLQLKAKVWTTISAEAQELLHGLLEVDQNLRLTAQEALKHRWFEGIDHCTAMPTSAPSSFRSSSSNGSSFMQQESF